MAGSLLGWYRPAVHAVGESHPDAVHVLPLDGHALHAPHSPAVSWKKPFAQAVRPVSTSQLFPHAQFVHVPGHCSTAAWYFPEAHSVLPNALHVCPVGHGKHSAAPSADA
jgi:hypothetical protein